MSDERAEKSTKGRGAVLRHHVARLPAWVFVVAAGIPGLVLGGGGGVLIATGALPLVPALAITGAGFGVATLIVAILLTSGVARWLVSEAEIDVQIGTHHLRIPIADVTSVEVAPSPARMKHGVGVSWTLDGAVIYSMLGDRRRAVHIGQAGKKGVSVLVCREPEALAGAIELARRRTPAGVGAETSEDPPTEEVIRVPKAAPVPKELDGRE